MKFEYHIECFAIDKWLKILTGSKHYCQGYFDAKEDYSPRLAYRIVRSDGKVVEEMSERNDVFIGQVAGWPTPEQYENVAKDALERAKVIREKIQILYKRS